MPPTEHALVARPSQPGACIVHCALRSKHTSMRDLCRNLKEKMVLDLARLATPLVVWHCELVRN